ncbi:MAG: hypothetical protein M9894_30075 [Planctomycetes bacterium]|nr:hypothetical protein [Planctomycetota bacterium]
MSARVATCLAVLLLGALGARAGEPPPVLEDVRADGRRLAAVHSGQVVELIGRDLHTCDGPACRHDELAVHFGQAPVMVLASSRERVVVIAPHDLPVGPCRARVTVLGRGTAELEVSVYARESTGCPGPLDSDARDVEDVRITAVEALTDELGTHVEVACAMDRVPDGMTVTISLWLGPRELEWRSVQVTTEAGASVARAVFGPFERPLPAGEYVARVLFELGKQPRRLGRAFRQRLPPEEASAFDRIERAARLRIGTALDADRERAQARARRLPLYDALEAALGEIERQAMAAGPAIDAWCASTLERVAEVVATATADDERTAIPVLHPGSHPVLLADVVLGALHDLARRVGVTSPAAPAPLALRRPRVEPDYHAAFASVRRGVERWLEQD